MPTDPPVRPTVRLLVVDDSERVLLFSSIDEAGLPFWCPVGGGIEAGESVEQAGRRELREETGLGDASIGPEVWRRRAVVRLDGVSYDCRERYFLVRVAPFAIDTGGFTDAEQSSIVEHRWWSLDDLARTQDRLVPEDLHERLRDLLAKGPPERPIVVDTGLPDTGRP